MSACPGNKIAGSPTVSSDENQPMSDTPRSTGQPPLLEKYFRALTKADASDLHLKADNPPHIRTAMKLQASTGEVFSNEDILEMAEELMTPSQSAFFHEHGNVDLAYEVEGGDRFRVNIFRQRGRVSLAVRRVTRNVPSFESLHLPPVMSRIAESHQGLVLLSGPTGSGKSTTIASMLQYINERRHCHIVTIEDPIEYLFVDDKALISQREIGIDVEDFQQALKYLMRQDPDVVLIGEMRDAETFQAGLQASETGHLVFGTVHASSAPQTIGRILDLFPIDGRDRVRQSLAFNLRAVVCQKLLPSIADDLDRVPAVDVLLTNPSVRQFIMESRDAELTEIIKTREVDGMISFTKSLLELIENELIEPKVGFEAAPNIDELKMLMKGIKTR
ncbi:MAG TPA: PilT/PilU family type 4a pilus ATPase [Phycisphaerae bacterium]|nr:PilT/PilU family type 4a pilus ATPase [Phycisphaerae bacterium]HDZ42685.1 PilT/PilU family type 4a pilus ATPase [Phycisphaerae bacterium]